MSSVRRRLAPMERAVDTMSASQNDNPMDRLLWIALRISDA
jgi:hypothetical protein